MVSKMILSFVMAVVIMVTGTDSSLIGKVKGIKLTEDRAADREDRLARIVSEAEGTEGTEGTAGIEAAGGINEVSNKIEDKKQVSFGTSMIQFVSSIQARDLSFPTVEEKAGKSITHTTADVSAYTSGYESTGKTLGDPEYGITASGKRVRENHTIACPKSLRFGTRIYVPKLQKTYTCEDRGSMITEGKLDIYIADLDQARKFGRQKLDVQIISRDEPAYPL